MAATSRISMRGDALIEEMVSLTGKSKVVIIEEALVQYRHHERMRLLNDGYDKLRGNKKQWAQALKERSELEGTNADGLEDE